MISQDFGIVPDVTTPELPRCIHDFQHRRIARRLIHPLDPEEEALIEITALQCYASTINAAALFRGIANREMGFEPTLDIAVYFLSPAADLAFFMYDDRGCVIYADHMSALAPLQTKYSQWILRP